jgi:hypothetical protein
MIGRRGLSIGWLVFAGGVGIFAASFGLLLWRQRRRRIGK